MYIKFLLSHILGYDSVMFVVERNSAHSIFLQSPPCLLYICYPTPFLQGYLRRHRLGHVQVWCGHCGGGQDNQEMFGGNSLNAGAPHTL